MFLVLDPHIIYVCLCLVIENLLSDKVLFAFSVGCFVLSFCHGMRSSVRCASIESCFFYIKTSLLPDSIERLGPSGRL